MIGFIFAISFVGVSFGLVFLLERWLKFVLAQRWGAVRTDIAAVWLPVFLLVFVFVLAANVGKML